MDLHLHNVPAELKTPPQCVAWKMEPGKDGKATKVPYQPANPQFKASSNNPKTWGTFEQAIAVASTDGFSGVGRVLTKDDHLGCVDLDHCRNSVTGAIEAWAWEIILKLNSYTEVSPSGEGVHIWVKVQTKTDTRKRKSGNIEIFWWGLYLTMTGNHLENTPKIIEDRQTELEALHKEIFGKPGDEPKPFKDPGAERTPAQTLDVSDHDLIAKASSARNGVAFSKLWTGYWAGDFPSQSEADQALANNLAFWTQKDAARMDRLFRKSELYRDKWDELRGSQTYGEMTISKAIAGCSDVWKGGKRKGKRKPARPQPPPPRESAERGQAI